MSRRAGPRARDVPVGSLRGHPKLPERHARARLSRRQTGQMIRDLDASLTAWLSELVPYAAMDVQAVAEAPTDSDRPALSLVLIDVREDLAASTHVSTVMRSDEGVVIGRDPARRRYRFTYVMTAFAKETVEEHAVLGSVLAGAATTGVLPEPFLRGAMSECAGQVLMRCAPQRNEELDHDPFPTWRIAGRLALELEVLAPLPAAAIEEVAEPPSRIELHSSGSYVPRQPNGAGAVQPRRPTATITEP